MKHFIFIIVTIFLANCHAKQIYFELSNDQQYPQLVTVSNVQYSLTSHRYIDISATVTIYEEIDAGTNVSKSQMSDI